LGLMSTNEGEAKTVRTLADKGVRSSSRPDESRPLSSPTTSLERLSARTPHALLLAGKQKEAYRLTSRQRPEAKAQETNRPTDKQVTHGADGRTEQLVV
jgi:hypothetical protein